MISHNCRCEPFVVQHTDPTTIIKTIVHWQHQRGGEGHCLARVYFQSDTNLKINTLFVLLSEIRSNPRFTGMGADFGDVANALITCLHENKLLVLDIAMTDIYWIAHYGRFSSYDAVGDDTFFHLALAWDGQRFQDLQKEQPLSIQAVQATLSSLNILELESVYQALEAIGWTRHNE
jgi:hypothetical protein